MKNFETEKSSLIKGICYVVKCRNKVKIQFAKWNGEHFTNQFNHKIIEEPISFIETNSVLIA